VVALAPWDSAATRWSVGDHGVVAFDISAVHLIAGEC
jgi:hypothetical protein